MKAVCASPSYLVPRNINSEHNHHVCSSLVKLSIGCLFNSEQLRRSLSKVLNSYDRVITQEKAVEIENQVKKAESTDNKRYASENSLHVSVAACSARVEIFLPS